MAETLPSERAVRTFGRGLRLICWAVVLTIAQAAPDWITTTAILWCGILGFMHILVGLLDQKPR